MKALVGAEKAIEYDPNYANAPVLLAAYAQSGAIEEAEWEADQVLTLNSGFSWERMRQTFPFKDSPIASVFQRACARRGSPSRRPGA